MKERRQILEANVTVIPNKIMLSETNFLKVRYHIQPQFPVMQFLYLHCLKENICVKCLSLPFGCWM